MAPSGDNWRQKSRLSGTVLRQRCAKIRLRNVQAINSSRWSLTSHLCESCAVTGRSRSARLASRPYVQTTETGMAVINVNGKKVVTVEGLAANGTLNKIQAAWVAADVPQCGYCQSGMVMAATALLAAKPNPTDADIDAAMTNICRCGTYVQVREAIHAASKA